MQKTIDAGLEHVTYHTVVLLIYTVCIGVVVPNSFLSCRPLYSLPPIYLATIFSFLEAYYQTLVFVQFCNTTLRVMVGKSVHSILSWDHESKSDLEYFRNIPWCSEVFSSPGIRPYRGSFPLRNDRGMDPVIHGFMFRDGGVMRHLSLLAESGVMSLLDVDRSTESMPLSPQLALDEPSRENNGPETQTTSMQATTGQEEYPVHIDLYNLGRSLQGVPDTIYGGVLTLLADGVCGRTAYMHRDPHQQVYTAYTNVRFVKALTFGSDGTATTLIKSQVSQRLTTQGKIVVNATMEGPGGVVHATVESMIMEKPWKGRL